MNWGRINLALAINAVCIDYHNGQSSRGYRLGCRVRRYLKRHGISYDQGGDSRKIAELAAKYGDKL